MASFGLESLNGVSLRSLLMNHYGCSFVILPIIRYTSTMLVYEDQINNKNFLTGETIGVFHPS